MVKKIHSPAAGDFCILRRMKSMTGYGRGDCAQDGFKITVELSSVNRKQAEISVNLPRELEMLEAQMRDAINRRVARGRVNGARLAPRRRRQARRRACTSTSRWPRLTPRELARLAKQLKLSGEVTLDQVLARAGRFPDGRGAGRGGGFLAGGGEGAEAGAGRAGENARARRRASGAGSGGAHRRHARRRSTKIQKQAPTTAENYRQQSARTHQERGPGKHRAG